MTGASAGVGRATVRAFAKRGARIDLIARGIDGLEAVKCETIAASGEALVLSVDVADAEEVERTAETVERRLGPIEVWINNAMTSVFSPVHHRPGASQTSRITARCMAQWRHCEG